MNAIKIRAIDENKETAAIFLIQTGCDLNSPRLPGPGGEGSDEVKDKSSPLHLCCQWGLETVVRVSFVFFIDILHIVHKSRINVMFQ